MVILVKEKTWTQNMVIKRDNNSLGLQISGGYVDVLAPNSNGDRQSVKIITFENTPHRMGWRGRAHNEIYGAGQHKAL